MLDSTLKGHQALTKLSKILSAMFLPLTALIIGNGKKRQTRSIMDRALHHS